MVANVQAVDVRTLAFDMPEAEMLFEVHAVGGAKADENVATLDVRKNRFSKPIPLRVGDYMIRSKQLKGDVKLSIPEGSDSRLLLVVIPSADQTFRILSLVDSAVKISKGDRFLMNASEDEVQVRFDKQIEKLKPGGFVYLKRGSVFDTQGRVEVEMARLKHGKWTMFNSTYWYDEPEMRVFLMMTQHPETGYPRIQGVTEVL